MVQRKGPLKGISCREADFKRRIRSHYSSHNMPTPTFRAGSPGLLLMLVVCVGTGGCLIPVGLTIVPTQTGRGKPCMGLGFAQIPFSLLGLGNSPVTTGNLCSGSGMAGGMPISFIKYVRAVLPQLRRGRLCRRAPITCNAKPDGRRDKREWWRGQTSGGDGKKVGTGISRAFKASQQLEDVVELKKKGGSSRPTIDDEGDWSGVYEGAPRSKKVPEFKNGERDSTGESFWLEYQMRVLCDTPQAAPFKPPTQVKV